MDSSEKFPLFRLPHNAQHVLHAVWYSNRKPQPQPLATRTPHMMTLLALALGLGLGWLQAFPWRHPALPLPQQFSRPDYGLGNPVSFEY